MTVLDTAQRALENNANNSSPPPENPGFSSRNTRYARRSMLQPETRLPRLCKCGRTLRADSVSVRHNGAFAGFAGLTTCGSVWVCPVCNAKVMARRALELGSAVAAAQGMGWQVGFMTLTMRHNSGQSLGSLWDCLSYAWGQVTAGQHWVKAKARYGIEGFIRVAEVTVGSNGWHVHIHCLVFFSAPVADDQGLMAWMFPRWQRALVRKGLDAPLALGQDSRILEGPADEALATYLTKSVDRGQVTNRIGLEMTSTQSKNARNRLSTRTPWMLIDEWFGDGDADAMMLWHEFEKASKGRRQITWSQGLRETLGLTVEKSDEEIAAEELGSKADDLLYITKDGWRDVVKTPPLIPQILEVTERSGLTGLRALLDEHCIEYKLPEEDHVG